MAELRIRMDTTTLEVEGTRDQLERVHTALGEVLEHGGHIRIPFPEGFHVMSRAISGPRSKLQVTERG